MEIYAEPCFYGIASVSTLLYTMFKKYADVLLGAYFLLAPRLQWL